MKTKSEQVFETFLNDNYLPFEIVEPQDSPRPDYLVQIGRGVFFEVKEISKDENFTTEPMKVFSRTIGDHIRSKMRAAKKQVRFGAGLGIPSVLLVYNNLDPIHLFGTEEMDFISAMYGAYTLRIDVTSGKTIDRFHGRDRSVGEDWNTSFSAVGRLYPVHGKWEVTLFENVFAKVKVPFDLLPPCFEVKRVEIERGQSG